MVIPAVPTEIPNRAVCCDDKQEIAPTQPNAEPSANIGASEAGAKPVRNKAPEPAIAAKPMVMM